MTIKTLDLVSGLIDMGAKETVLLGIGRVQLVDADFIRFSMLDQFPGDAQQIKHYYSWPLHRWLQAHRDCARVAQWVQRELGAFDFVPPRPFGPRIVEN